MFEQGISNSNMNASDLFCLSGYGPDMPYEAHTQVPLGGT